MRHIRLTRGRVALVDDADFDWLSQWKWYAQSNGRGGFYAARRAKRPGHHLILMHSFILGTTGRTVVTDHKDGDGLNNQRANLRRATASQNMMNKVGKPGGSSRFKGVWFDAQQGGSKKWRTAITLQGQLKYLGRFATEEEAADAYAAATREHFGEFANTAKGISQ